MASHYFIYVMPSLLAYSLLDLYPLPLVVCSIAGVRLQNPGRGEKELIFPEVRPRKFEPYSPV